MLTAISPKPANHNCPVSISMLLAEAKPMNEWSIRPYGTEDFANAHEGYTLEEAQDSARNAQANDKRFTKLAAQWRQAVGCWECEQMARQAEENAANARGMLILHKAASKSLKARAEK